MSGTATLFSATGTVYDQIVSGVKKHAKSTVIKSVFEQLKDVLILWIIAIQIALSTIENQQFRDLIVLCSKSLAECIPKAAETIRKWIMEAYVFKRV